jgi:hypothetical protein
MTLSVVKPCSQITSVTNEAYTLLQNERNWIEWLTFGIWKQRYEASSRERNITAT